MNRVKPLVACLILACSSGLNGGVADFEYPVIGLYANYSQAAEDAGVNILFPSIYYYDFDLAAKQYSGKESDTWKRHADAAHRGGMKMIPSLAMAIDNPPDSKMADKTPAWVRDHPQFTEKKRDGSPSRPYGSINLSWGYPEVRAYKVEAVRRGVIRTGVDGVLLDYTRYFGPETGYSDIIVKQFKEKTGRDAFKIPIDDPEWLRFRADYITLFVRDLRKAMDGLEPRREIWACVDPDPQRCLRMSMNDWQEWAELGYLDGVLTMIYENDTNKTLQEAMIANAATRGMVPHIPMIAAGYAGNLVTPRSLREASLNCLKTGTPGVAYYRSDSVEKHNHWVTIKEVSGWDRKTVEAGRYNHFLNPGFEDRFEKWAIGDGRRLRITTDHARTGERSASMAVGHTASIVQIVDKGFLADKSTLEISAWLLQPVAPKKGHSADIIDRSAIALTVRVHYKDETEQSFRVPVTVEPGADWQQVRGAVPIRGSDELKFVIAGIEAASPLGPFQMDAGTVFVDDIEIGLSNADPTSSAAEVNLSEAPRENKRKINLVRGRCVTESSNNGANVEGANAVDGDLSVADHSSHSAWRSGRPAKDQWIKIYLPETYLISRVRLLNNASIYYYRTKSYKLEVSVDDVEYRQIAAGMLPNEGDTWTELNFDPVPARYIRFTGIDGYHHPGTVGLMEMEVY
ncbi:MAG: hypothetical protein CMJ18_04515 [Phycisphaeraceae bacterium]|nr:hypothetical protein [Phycisphaeraceae bacterium]